MLAHGQRIYSLCQGSPTHCLLVAGVLFTKVRGRKANVRRFLLSRIHWHGLSWRLTAFSIEFLTVLMATLSGILYITTLFREIIRLVTSLAIKSITDSTLILSSNSEVTISLDNSSRRGDSVFSSNLRSSCFNKEPASDST
ncbi:hypothetical protein Smp_108600 [Schistosoma mansoni]|uniref:hypothetical protein n=1 Tax=Schistosoma mansoni TaxID=6183 RepID=UPI00022C8265|nr:hypothetical protein Smp_108600 [Schistosoma mansoni]|eukprot:XP_018646006.1 hypothetical protein Smp_108600 [Schistosoma mansoni]